MLQNVKFHIFTVTVFVTFISIFKRRCLERKALPSGKKTEELRNLVEVKVEGGEFFGGVDEEKSSVVIWGEEFKKNWKFTDGGYLLFVNRVILPTTSGNDTIIKTGEKYRWIPYVGDDEVLLKTNNVGVINKNKNI